MLFVPLPVAPEGSELPAAEMLKLIVLPAPRVRVPEVSAEPAPTVMLLTVLAVVVRLPMF